jgi:MFS family permease
VIADRWNKHRLLLFTQILAMVQAFTFTVLVLTDSIHIWHIIVLSTLLGIINAFDMPIRQSFMIEMIDDKKDLGNAIALNSSMVNGGRMIGPAIAGIFIAAFGMGICFLINALSYIAVIASLLMMKINKAVQKKKHKEIWHELKTGFTYVRDFEPIRALLLLLALVSLMGMPYSTLLPAFAQDVLHGGPSTLGFLMGLSGMGALGGAVFLASRSTVRGLGKIVPISSALFGCSLILFSFSPYLWLSLPLMLLIGFGQMLEMAVSNTLVQTLVDDDKRGRIMSLYSMALMGMTPVGSLIAGSLASRIGPQWTVAIGGIACVLGAIWFARKLPAIREQIRPIYRRMGIIPEIATGIDNASQTPK